jgi:hypothetical protein
MSGSETEVPTTSTAPAPHGYVRMSTFAWWMAALVLCIVGLVFALLALTVWSSPGTTYYTSDGTRHVSTSDLHSALKKASKDDRGAPCFLTGHKQPYLGTDGNKVVRLTGFILCGDGGAGDSPLDYTVYAVVRLDGRVDSTVPKAVANSADPDGNPPSADGYGHFTP